MIVSIKKKLGCDTRKLRAVIIETTLFHLDSLWVFPTGLACALQKILLSHRSGYRSLAAGYDPGALA